MDAKSDFFDVLHLPVRLMEVTRVSGKLPQNVLCQDTWIRELGGKRNIAGTKLDVGSVDAIVAGIAFGGSTGFPGSANAWLPGSDPERNGTIGNDSPNWKNLIYSAASAAMLRRGYIRLAPEPHLSEPGVTFFLAGLDGCRISR